MTASNLAQQALNNLVSQFARPMDFLRELVQNAIDAGSPRVEVWVKHTPAEAAGEEGVLEIHVDDFGEGMDEDIIDAQLTRMFSSAKEDDLTKIGKFGIGFTSIFAIGPEAVLLHTGRHGEYWELLFHPDRTFDKVKVDRPVDGTRITLFKRLPDGDVERVTRECRWILRYWCEHSDTPITFWDRTGEQASAPLHDADPFAAFASPAPAASGPEQITRPMDLLAELCTTLREGAIEVMIGYTSQPRYGFYNGGLTLLNTRSREPLGPLASRLAHLSFKVKSDALEHTLTRDNVIQDAHWERVMAVLVQAARQLQEALLERLHAAAHDGESIQPWLRYLAQDCKADPDIRQLDALWERIWLQDHRGRPVSLSAVDAQRDTVGAVLLDPGPGPLREALEAEGLLLLPDEPAVRELLRAAPQDALWSRQLRTVLPAQRIFVLPQLIDPSALPPRERDLLRDCAALLQAAVGRRIVLKIGDYGGQERGIEEELALDAPVDGELFQRPQQTRFRLPLLLKRRTLLINRHHPFFRAQIVAAAHSPLLAAFGLASALLHTDNIDAERTHRKLLAAAAEGLPRR